jgi:hypothetical protein
MNSKQTVNTKAIFHVIRADWDPTVRDLSSPARAWLAFRYTEIEIPLITVVKNRKWQMARMPWKGTSRLRRAWFSNEKLTRSGRCRDRVSVVDCTSARTPSVPLKVSLENRVLLTNTFPGRHFQWDRGSTCYARPLIQTMAPAPLNIRLQIRKSNQRAALFSS